MNGCGTKAAPAERRQYGSQQCAQGESLAVVFLFFLSVGTIPSHLSSTDFRFGTREKHATFVACMPHSMNRKTNSFSYSAARQQIFLRLNQSGVTLRSPCPMMSSYVDQAFPAASYEDGNSGLPSSRGNVKDIEEALVHLRHARAQLNYQLLNRKGLDQLISSVPPDEIGQLKAAYARRMSDTVSVLSRVNRAIDLLETGGNGSLEKAMLCLQGSEEHNIAISPSITRH